MKKTIIGMMALFSFHFAIAQHLSAGSTAGVTLTLQNAIEIQPDQNWTYATTFQTPADYNNLTSAGYMGSNTWTINSTKAGKVSLVFTKLVSTPPVQRIILQSALSYSTNGTTYTQAAASISNAGTFTAGSNRQFNMSLKVNPGWSNPGGVYTGNVTVTASQL